MGCREVGGWEGGRMGVGIPLVNLKIINFNFMFSKILIPFSRCPRIYETNFHSFLARAFLILSSRQIQPDGLKTSISTILRAWPQIRQKVPFQVARVLEVGCRYVQNLNQRFTCSVYSASKSIGVATLMHSLSRFTVNID